MSLLPDTKIPTTWVKGITKQSSSSGFDYKNHCYGQCGDSVGVPPCMVSYFVNDDKGPVPYSILEKVIDVNSHAGSDKITYTSTCPDYSLCPVIGGISPQVQWDNNNPQCSIMNGANANLACLYPLATFQDEKNVAQYVSTFGENDDYNDVILPYFCSSQVKATTSQQCPLDPFTDLPMTFCSQIVSNPRCGDWIRNQLNSGDQDQADNANNLLNNYCKNFNTPDCDCINRQQNPVYQVMATGSIYPDKCWWTPCKDTTQNTYLVPSVGLEECDVDNTVYCPSINLVIGGNSQNLSFSPSNYTDCSGSIDNGGGGGSGGGDDDSSSIWSKYWWAILLIVAVIITIIVIIIVLL